VEPAEFLLVEMALTDAYGVRRVLEQARPSQPLDVTVRVANFGQEILTLELPCPFFRVMTRDGDVVGPSTAPCSDGPSTTFSLSPGESRVVSSPWGGEGLDGTTLPRDAYGLESWTRRLDRSYRIQTAVEWVCLLPDGFPPPNPVYHDCGLPGDVLPSRALFPATRVPHQQ
jgi:hypothetical protein